MITELSAENFKSWRSTGPVRLAPITALFGANSSGKTSLLQLLLMLKQTAASSDQDQVLQLGGHESALVDLGSVQDVLFQHNLSRPLSFRLAWDAPSIVSRYDVERHQSFPEKYLPVEFSAQITWFGGRSEGLGRMVLDRMAYQFDHREEFGAQRADEAGDGYNFFAASLHEADWPSTAGMVARRQLAKCYGFRDLSDPAFGPHRGILSYLMRSFEGLFSDTYYLGPLRAEPIRPFVWRGTEPSDVGPRGENAVAALLASRERGAIIQMQRSRKLQTLEQRVAQWLKELRLVSDFEIRPVDQGGDEFHVWVKQSSASPEVRLADVGLGVSQVLPVITLCYYAPKGSTILLEQPDVHLHPAIQSNLADVFIHAAQTRGIQIVLESHSEHLVRRLQRRIAEQKLKADDAALYFCSVEKGASNLTALELDELGNISNWPEEFFGDTFGELYATEKARLKRMAPAS
jgi:predicted ATPase